MFGRAHDRHVHPNVSSLPATPRTLNELEGVVQRGLAAFLEVGYALQEIRDRRLYSLPPLRYRTFESYLRERVGVSRSHVFRLIDAARVDGALSPAGDRAPGRHVSLGSERAARALVPLLDTPDVLRDVAEMAGRLGGGTISSRNVQRVLATRGLGPARSDRAPSLDPTVGAEQLVEALALLRFAPENDVVHALAGALEAQGAAGTLIRFARHILGRVEDVLQLDPESHTEDYPEARSAADEDLF